PSGLDKSSVNPRTIVLATVANERRAAKKKRLVGSSTKHAVGVSTAIVVAAVAKPPGPAMPVVVPNTTGAAMKSSQKIWSFVGSTVARLARMSPLLALVIPAGSLVGE